jgi:hypothetical protein
MSTKTKTKPDARCSLHAVARRHRARAIREARRIVKERISAENDGRSCDAIHASREHKYWIARVEAIDELMADVSPSAAGQRLAP